MTQAKGNEKESQRALQTRTVPREVMHQHMMKEKIKRKKETHKERKRGKSWLLCTAQTHMICAEVSFIRLTHFRKHMMFILGMICTESFRVRTEICIKKVHVGFKECIGLHRQPSLRL